MPHRVAYPTYAITDRFPKYGGAALCGPNKYICSTHAKIVPRYVPYKWQSFMHTHETYILPTTLYATYAIRGKVPTYAISYIFCIRFTSYICFIR